VRLGDSLGVAFHDEAEISAAPPLNDGELHLLFVRHRHALAVWHHHELSALIDRRRGLRVNAVDVDDVMLPLVRVLVERGEVFPIVGGGAGGWG
jgi:hypothetical protein